MIDYIKSPQDQTEHLKNEANLLTGELNDKNAFAKPIFNTGSYNINKQHACGNQDQSLCDTTSESNTLLKKDKANNRNTDNNRGNNNKNKDNSIFKNTVLPPKDMKNDIENNKTHESDLKNSDIMLKAKK